MEATSRRTSRRPAVRQKTLSGRWNRAPALLRDNWHVLAGVALLLGVWRMSILVLSLLWSEIGITNPWPDEYAGMRLWRFSVRWDAEWYLRIAEEGYAYTPGEPSSVAFFPGLPMAISVFDLLLPASIVFAGLVVVHLALFAALVYVYLLARLDFSRGVAWWAVGFLLMFPAALFYSAIYPQSLLLVGIAGALYHARRGQWWLAAIFGFLAGSTSLAGMLIVVPLALELLRQGDGHRLNLRDTAAVAVTPLGGLAYVGYLWARFGSAGVYFDSHPLSRDGTIVSSLLNGSDYLRAAEDTVRYPNGAGGSLSEIFLVTDITLICVFLIAGLLLWWRVRPSYGALVVMMTALPVVSGAPPGIGRHVAVLFPVFILLARIAHEGVRMTLSIIFTVGLALTAFFFVQGFWAG